MSQDLKTKIKSVKLAIEGGLIDNDEASQLLDSIEFFLRNEDILEWGKYYFKDRFTLPFCEKLHRYFIEIADKPLTCTLAPRGHAKTTIKCFLIPIFLALNHPEKFKHYLNVQATSTKAVAVNLSIRHELEENELIIRDYGDQVSKTKWTEKQFILNNGVIFSALGAGDSVRGINYGNIRPDYVVLDDLYDEAEIENPWLISKTNRWFWGAIYKAVANDKPTSIHIQGTAINKSDIMHLLMNKERWVWKKFQAIDWDKNEVLWPENNSLEKLMNDKADMGSIIFEREMQNNTRDDETSVIKEGWIRLFSGVIPGDQSVVKVVGGVDPAAGLKELNDFTGKVAVAITNLGNYFVIDAKNDKFTFDENIRDIEAWHKRIRFSELRCEAIAGFKLMAQEIRRRADVPLKEVNAVKDKMSRLISVSPKFENGKVFISSKIDERIRVELVEQLIVNKPPHDDLRDALILCLEDYSREFYFGVL